MKQFSIILILLSLMMVTVSPAVAEVVTSKLSVGAYCGITVDTNLISFSGVEPNALSTVKSFTISGSGNSYAPLEVYTTHWLGDSNNENVINGTFSKFILDDATDTLLHYEETKIRSNSTAVYDEDSIDMNKKLNWDESTEMYWQVLVKLNKEQVSYIGDVTQIITIDVLTCSTTP